MTAATEFLLQTGAGALFAGLNLWVVLFLVAAVRDPKGCDLFAWSIGTQFAATGRILRRAMQFRVWGRLAGAVVVLGVTCLVFSGTLAVIHLFVAGPAR